MTEKPKNVQLSFYFVPESALVRWYWQKNHWVKSDEGVPPHTVAAPAVKHRNTAEAWIFGDVDFFILSNFACSVHVHRTCSSRSDRLHNSL